VKLAIEGGCNAVATTFGVLGLRARKYAHKIPFIVKINHNELLTYPNKFDQTMFGSVQQASTWARRRRRDHLLRLARIDAARSRR
jgi:class I fructose-bisphosphate aldolase